MANDTARGRLSRTAANNHLPCHLPSANELASRYSTIAFGKPLEAGTRRRLWCQTGWSYLNHTEYSSSGEPSRCLILWLMAIFSRSTSFDTRKCGTNQTTIQRRLWISRDNPMVEFRRDKRHSCPSACLKAEEKDDHISCEGTTYVLFFTSNSHTTGQIQSKRLKLISKGRRQSC